MTDREFDVAVQSHFGEFTDEFKTRIHGALPTAISRFCNEWQWEFLDKYTTLSTETSTQDASGKTIFTLPTDFFKVVAIWTDNHDVEYRTRTEWAALQRNNASSEEPAYYTVIGKELVLAAPNDGSSVYWVYTRDSSNFSLGDVPAQYHYAIQMAVHELLAPAYVTIGDTTVSNPDVRSAAAAFRQAVTAARTIELRSKARGKRILPPEHVRMVNNY